MDLSGVWRSDGKSVEGAAELAKALGYGPAKRLMFTNQVGARGKRAMLSQHMTHTTGTIGITITFGTVIITPY